jgi:hypothetical protein
MRQDLDDLKNKSKDLQVDEALSYVRTIEARPKLTTLGVLLFPTKTKLELNNKSS